MSFLGYLIKFNKTGKLFPHRLIDGSSYQSTPLQRTEVKAYRDSNNLLHRTTSPNSKTKIVFKTLPLTLAQMQEVRGLLNSAFDNAQQRKLRITYWDDELLSYRTMTAYIPDVTYQPSKITDSDIRYEPVEFTFIEY